MSDPTITDYPGTIPGKSQSQAAFDTNVDAFLDWLTATNVPEYKLLAIWIRARVLEVAATALSGDLPSITGQAGKALVVNAAETAAAFAPLSGRNMVINGSGRINQRGYVSGTATGAANQFTLDRWFVIASGQNLTFTGTDAGRTMTAPAGGAAQVIEGANIAGGTYVINWTGTATCTVDGTSRGKGDTFTLTANTNAVVRFTGGTFTDVQIELGTVATAFERMKFGQELLSCQRYYAFGFGVGGALYPPISAAGINARRLYVSFPVFMRATPTLTVGVANIASPSIIAYAKTGAHIFGVAGADVECSVLESTASAELTS